MAIIKDNIVMEGVSGMLGDVVVFRQLRGKTIMANKPRKPRFQSDLQRENRHRFREASAFAKQAMLDPQKKEYYQAKARKLGLPNAYTAALTDYMRKPAVTAVKYKGNTSGSIAITAGKAGFSLASVTVAMVNKEGEALATGTAVLKDRRRNEWTARLAPDLWNQRKRGEGDCAVRVMITATDHLGNAVSSTLAA
jgi:hypothetical protein